MALGPWKTADLPAPPPFRFRNILAVIGPGTIALSASIGGGEWLLGPATIVQYGFSLMWIVTLGVTFQLLLNLEFIRYTLYTGEPVVNGFMRTRPGALFWAVAYILLALCQVGWPGLAASSASTIFATFAGHLPHMPDDKLMHRLLGAGTFLLTIGIVAVGGKVERMLEWVNWFMVAFILIFLLVVDILFVPARIWGEGLLGHFKFGALPPNADWMLLAAFAGFAGNGGIGNVWTSNWIRDKGFGMGSVVGYISSAVGGKAVKVSPVGSVFPINPENLSKWRQWWRYVRVDQVWIWALGCFIGMYLNVILAAALIPPGTDMGQGLSAGAMQADYISREAARTFDSVSAGRAFWFLTLLNGFWILFGTQLTIVDGFVRLSTDIVWSGSARVRDAAKGDIRRVYYALLVLYAVWGSVAINLTQPFLLVKIMANVAGFILVVAGVHVLALNRTRLPRELRPSPWREGAVLLAVAFYAFFTAMNLKGVGKALGLW